MSLALLILLAANLSDHIKLPYKEILKTNMPDSQNIYKGEEFGTAMYNIRTTTDKHRKGMIWELSRKKQNKMEYIKNGNNRKARGLVLSHWNSGNAQL